MALRAGRDWVNITPPLGIWMTGFAGRKGPATDVHDSLKASALVIEVDGKKAAILGVDVLALDYEQVARIQKLVEEWTDIPGNHVLINTSHTHSGPATIQLNAMGRRDEAYCDVLVRQIATAIKLANEDLKPAKLSFGKEHVVIAVNRREVRPDGTVVLGRNPNGPIDPNVYVLRFDDEDDDPFAIVFSYAAHPVVLGATNQSFSGDYVHYACFSVEQFFFPLLRVDAVFLQGCSGNINPDIVGGTFKDAEKLGRMLGAAAAKAAACAEPVEVDVLKVVNRTLDLPLEDPPILEEAERMVMQQEEALIKAQQDNDPVRIRISEGMLKWAQDVLELSKEGKKPRTQPFAMQAIRIGDVAILGMAGEVFIELALDTMKRSPFEKTIVLGYSNGCIGYVPTAAAYQEGGYEVTGAIRFYGTLMIAPESERLITEAAVEMLQELAS